MHWVALAAHSPSPQQIRPVGQWTGGGQLLLLPLQLACRRHTVSSASRHTVPPGRYPSLGHAPEEQTSAWSHSPTAGLHSTPLVLRAQPALPSSDVVFEAHVPAAQV